MRVNLFFLGIAMGTFLLAGDGFTMEAGPDIVSGRDTLVFWGAIALSVFCSIMGFRSRLRADSSGDTPAQKPASPATPPTPPMMNTPEA